MEALELAGHGINAVSACLDVGASRGADFAVVVVVVITTIILLIIIGHFRHLVVDATAASAADRGVVVVGESRRK